MKNEKKKIIIGSILVILVVIILANIQTNQLTIVNSNYNLDSIVVSDNTLTFPFSINGGREGEACINILSDDLHRRGIVNAVGGQENLDLLYTKLPYHTTCMGTANYGKGDVIKEMGVSLLSNLNLCLYFGSADQHSCTGNVTIELIPKCDSHNEKRCVNDNLVWFDSCGNQEELIESCQYGCGELPCGEFCSFERPFGCIEETCVENDRKCQENNILECKDNKYEFLEECDYKCELGVCLKKPINYKIYYIIGGIVLLILIIFIIYKKTGGKK